MIDHPAPPNLDWPQDSAWAITDDRSGALLLQKCSDGNAPLQHVAQILYG